MSPLSRPRQHERITRRNPGFIRAGLTLAGLLAFAGVGVTSAGFSDTANLNLGGETLGSEHAFGIEVKDASTPPNWVSTAKTVASPVSIAFNGNTNQTLGTSTARRFATTFRLQTDSPQGSVTPVIEKPAGCLDSGADLCETLLPYLRFTAWYGNQPPFATDVSMDEFNLLTNRSITIAGATEQILRFDVKIHPSFLTPDTQRFKDTKAMFGIELQGASVAP